MTTAIKKQLTRLERQQAQLEKLTNEANALEVENARLRDKKRLMLEEGARTSPGTVSKMFRGGGAVNEIDRKIKRNEKRLEHIREEASALGVAIGESEAQRVEERTEAYRERQAEIHAKELEGFTRLCEAWDEMVRRYYEEYAPSVIEVRQLPREAQSEGLRNPGNEEIWGKIGSPAIQDPKGLETFLVNCLDASFRGGNGSHPRIFEEKVTNRQGVYSLDHPFSKSS